MLPKELLDYLRTQLSEGHDESTLRHMLVKEGWDPMMVDEGLRSVELELTTALPGTLPFAPIQPEVHSEKKSTDSVQTSSYTATETKTALPLEPQRQEPQAHGHNNQLVPAVEFDHQLPGPRAGALKHPEHPAVKDMSGYRKEMEALAASTTEQVIPKWARTSTPDPKDLNLPVSQSATSLSTAAGSTASVLPDEPLGEGSKPSGGKKGVWIGLIVLLLFLILAGVGGVWAYFQVWLSPERVIQRMALAMEDVKTVSYEGTLDMQAQFNDPVNLSMVPGQTGQVLGTAFPTMSQFSETPSIGVSMTFNGQSDHNDFAHPNEEASFDVSIKGEGLGFSVGKGVLGLDLKMLDRVIYGRVRDLPELEDVDLSFIADQWIKVDLQKLEEEEGWEIEKLDQRAPLTEDQKKQLEKAWLEKPFIVVGKGDVLPDEEIDGRKSYHYRFTLDKNNLVDFLTRLSAIDGELVSQADVDRFKKALEDVTLPKGELWIDKQTWHLRQIKMHTSIKETEPTEYSAKVDFSLKMNKFNEVVAIQEPEETISIEELQERFETSPMMLEQSAAMRDTQRRSDLYALSSAIEQYAVEHNGTLPSGIPLGEDNATFVGTEAGGVNLNVYLVPDYLAEIPVDPAIGTPENSGYAIFRTTTNELTLMSIGEGDEAVITVTR